jgi:hypothetical protein
VAFGEAVELRGGDAGLERLLDQREDLGHDPAGRPHLRDVGLGVALDHASLPTGATPASVSTWLIAAATAGIGCSPSTVCSLPLDR